MALNFINAWSLTLKTPDLTQPYPLRKRRSLWGCHSELRCRWRLSHVSWMMDRGLLQTAGGHWNPKGLACLLNLAPTVSFFLCCSNKEVWLQYMLYELTFCNSTFFLAEPLFQTRNSKRMSLELLQKRLFLDDPTHRARFRHFSLSTLKTQNSLKVWPYFQNNYLSNQNLFSLNNV